MAGRTHPGRNGHDAAAPPVVRAAPPAAEDAAAPPGAEDRAAPPAAEDRAAAPASAGLGGAVSSLTRLPRAVAGRAARELAGQVSRRIPTADLDERDPDYIREQLPGLWLLASLWFRGEVRGLGNIPDDEAVLIVGNHSGGNLTPDTHVFTLAFSSYFGVERACYQLAHNLVLAFPGLGRLRRFGVVAASPENARRALETGAALLVYPGGDHEVHRPSWEGAKVDFGGRKGWIRLALEHDVPVVPLVSVGGQETALFLTRGEGLARFLRLDRTLRLKVLPVSLSLPWILNVGDFAGHLPLPAKITIEALPPIHLREHFGPDPDLDVVYDHITGLMQAALDALSAERRLPVLG